MSNNKNNKEKRERAIKLGILCAVGVMTVLICSDVFSTTKPLDTSSVETKELNLNNKNDLEGLMVENKDVDITENEDTVSEEVSKNLDGNKNNMSVSDERALEMERIAANQNASMEKNLNQDIASLQESINNSSEKDESSIDKNQFQGYDSGTDLNAAYDYYIKDNIEAKEKNKEDKTSIVIEGVNGVKDLVQGEADFLSNLIGIADSFCDNSNEVATYYMDGGYSAGLDFVNEYLVKDLTNMKNLDCYGNGDLEKIRDNYAKGIEVSITGYQRLFDYKKDYEQYFYDSDTYFYNAQDGLLKYLDTYKNMYELIKKETEEQTPIGDYDGENL